MALCFVFLLTAACILVSVAVRRRRIGRGGALGEDQELMLPPGSMGLPYVGETLLLYHQNPSVFFASKQMRYGDIFKTHLLGCPCVMLASPEAARFVLVTHQKLFKPTYPPSKERMIGPSALFFHQGDYHLRLRRLVQGSLGPDALRALLPDVESAVASTLAAWDGHVASTFHAMKRLSFEVGITTIFGSLLDGRHKEELRRNYAVVEKGYNCFPNRIPGTLYYRAVQARKRLREILGEIMADRRARGDQQGSGGDILGGLMRAAALTDDQVADNVIGVLFAAQDTTASVLTWILKYLRDHPKLLDAVKAEQMATYEANEGGKRPLTWAQTRGMTLTHAVIMESLRMASIISFTFREAVADVEYKGFLIPKGWKVMPLFRNIHHSPEYFQDPDKFDPSRFKVSPRPNTFLPFGSGAHACPGNELAKLEMLVLLHRLVTAYRWEVVGSSDGVEYSPFPVPRRGLRAKLWKAEGDGGAAVRGA
ncbi:abscisic acid 8'-hydroxylase 2 [Lolium perenne]|uniref:abscisic acid 8'-hydroxylase 2 n=1 Tax=Lolium perenne TaxID=4522 RepID=UPI0021EA13D3|nr:abscisic acid 8'-hydroxylase 2-like [Lolium perenne]